MTGRARDIAAAIKALMPTTVTIDTTVVSPTTYDTTTGTTTAPADYYYVLLVRVPSVLARSEGASVHAHEVAVRVTSVGRTAGAARDLTSAVESALDQSLPVADGWVLGPLLEINATGPTEDLDVTFTNGSRAIYTVTEFVLTACRTA